MQTQLFKHTHDQASLQSLCDAIEDYRFNFEKAITALDMNPVDQAPLYTAIGVIQELKIQTKNEDLLQAAELCTQIESIFDALITQNFAFIHLLSEVLLLSYDHLFDLVNNCLHPSANFNEQQSKSITLSLTEIVAADNTTLCQLSESALQALTSQFLILEENESVASLVTQRFSEKNENQPAQWEIDRTIKVQQDLVFFRLLMVETSHRFPNIKLRSERILPLAIEMNEVAGNPVNPVQLEAAIYVHDIGMSFIPDEVLTKKENFSTNDRLALERHPILIAEMLRRMEVWNEAADIVQQHHEKPNGSGYPFKLQENQICAGAKIMAILDAFDAMTNVRSDRPFKKTILRAVREIVTNYDQFDSDLAQIFIQIIKAHYSS